MSLWAYELRRCGGLAHVMCKASLPMDCIQYGMPAHGMCKAILDVLHLLDVLDLASGHAYNMGCLPLGQGEASQKSGVSLLALTLHWGGAPTH
jgi:hypothetical protein